jgi:hypothetical protein
MRPVWLWHAAFLGKFLGVVCHCFPVPLDVPTFAARCLHVPIKASAPSSEMWNCGREWSGNFAEMTSFYAILVSFTCRKSATRDKGRHAEDFFARKIRRLRPGANPRSWVPEASILTTRPPKPSLPSSNIKLTFLTLTQIFLFLTLQFRFHYLREWMRQRGGDRIGESCFGGLDNPRVDNSHFRWWNNILLIR